MKYESTSILLHIEEDSYQNGCEPGTDYSTCYDWPIRANTLDEYLNELCQHTIWTDADELSYELNACEEPGRIDVCVLLDENHHPASKEEIESWKLGNKKLYNGNYTVYVESVTREPATL